MSVKDVFNGATTENRRDMFIRSDTTLEMDT